MTDISRRKFIQLSVIGSAIAATGCESKYDSRIYKAEALGTYGGYDNRALPYVNQPDGYQDGVPQYFASVCQMCPAGCGIYVRTMAGRALNVAGNPAHPVSGGKVCARGIASLQHLYEPSRLRFPAMRAGRTEAFARTDWETALTRTLAGIQSAGGQTVILADAMTFGTMPTLSRLIGQFAAGAGAKTYSYSLLDDAPWRAAAKQVYGHNQVPAYQLDQADYLVAFSSNFLEAWPSPVYYNRLFGEFRQGPRRAQGNHGKFVYIGPRMSMTAAKADQWLPCNPGTESAVALGILTVLGGSGIPVEQAASASGLTADQITAVAEGMRAAGPRALAMGGDILMSQQDGTAAMVSVEALNAQVKSACVGFGQAALPAAPLGSGASYAQIQKLTAQMQSGTVGAVLLLGQPNPAFSLPTASGFADALSKVPFVAALTPYEDETTAHADVLLPTRTFLEDWGDDLPAVLTPGARMATLRQPIVDPQFITTSPGLSPANYAHDVTPWMDTRPTGDILIDLAKRLGKPLVPTDTRDAVRRTWAGLKQADLTAPSTDDDSAWVAAVSKGGYWTVTASVPAVGAATAPAYSGPSGAPASGSFALQLFPHIYWTDGRHSNLGWLQETADPMTMAVWNNWVEINLQTAEQMGIRTGDIVRLTSAHGSIDVPAVPYPGLHPNVVAMPIGHGHTIYGGDDTHKGVNPLAIVDATPEAATGALAWGATTVQIAKIRSAKDGWHPELNTLVLAQDNPGGEEPNAVMDLIHTTAREWKQAHKVTGAPQAAATMGED